MRSHIVTDGDKTNIVVFLDGEMLVADHTHPNFDVIKEKVEKNDETDLARVFDPTVEIARKFEQVTNIISVAGGNVFAHGARIDGAYADLLVEYLDSDASIEECTALALFLDKTHSNIDEHTRNQLDRWMNSGEGFTIDGNGDIRGYRGLLGDFTSKHAGPGIVNGVHVNGHLDNSPGNVLEMERAKVTNDPRVSCAVGLHVGTFSYAKSWAGGGKIVEVVVDPRNVVSVPTDAGDRKMRVSKYTVLREVTEPHTDKVVFD